MIDRRSLLMSSSLLLLSGCVTGQRQASIVSNPRIARIEERIGGRMGVALVDSSGILITSHRGSERFAMCSTFKAPLASALFAAHDRGAVDMYAKIILTEADLVPYAPVVEKILQAKQPATLFDMAKAAAETSDNAAANLVLKAIGGPAGFTAFVRSQGDSVTRLDRYETDLNENVVGDPRDTTTPVAMARLLQQVLIKDSVEDVDKLNLQKWMKDSKTGLSRIRAGLPAGWPAGDKTGTAPGGTAYNDVAIIWPSRAEYGVSPLILTVYTDRPKASAKRVNAAIADVARAIVPLVALPD